MPLSRPFRKILSQIEPNFIPDFGGGKPMDFQENNGYNAGVRRIRKEANLGIRKSREIIWRVRGCHADIELDREEGG